MPNTGSTVGCVVLLALAGCGGPGGGGTGGASAGSASATEWDPLPGSDTAPSGSSSGGDDGSGTPSASAEASATDTSDTSSGGDAMDLCPNILSDLIDRHGEAEGVAFYRRRFGVDNDVESRPEPHAPPDGGRFISPLSGLEFWELTENARTTGASERNHTFFNVDGTRALVRAGSSSTTTMFLVTDLGNLPAARPTVEPIALGPGDIGVEEWDEVASKRFWHPTDPDRFCWLSGTGLYCYDVAERSAAQEVAFARGPVSAIGDGSDLAGGRFIVYLADDDAAFIYDIAARAVVTTDDTAGPAFGDEVMIPVDGATPEPTFPLLRGPDDVDYARLTEDGKFAVWINKDGGNAELRDLSGRLIGFVAEDKNHCDGAWYVDDAGARHYVSLRVSGSANSGEGDVFEGFARRLWAGVRFSVTAQMDGTWALEREPFVVGDTSYGGAEIEYNDTVATQFSAFAGNPYAMAGGGWVSGPTAPTYGVYSILPILDARAGQAAIDIDRVAYVRVSETHVGTQAEPVIGPMGADGSYVALIRTPWYGDREQDNRIYATRIFPRLTPAWHDTVMNTGSLPPDWSCD